jgi:uncharacterized FAD-dependent dehydrogenase
MTDKTGGPAFPYQEVLPDGMANLTPQIGMTLRDYFAAKAMQTMTHRNEANVQFIAIQAYAMADEMLKAREQ